MRRYGAGIDPPNRFESVRRIPDPEQVEHDHEYLKRIAQRPIEYLVDSSRSIVSENHSPDLPFRYSINPYRGCAHGCSYCYARNTHEYLGFNAGLDFETKIVVKPDAPELLRTFLSRKNYKPEVLTFSGVTDCYQPAERSYQLTRQCLLVALECRHPVGIVTKNSLVTRDVDILSEMARRNLVQVFLSIGSVDPELSRDMEPLTSPPAARIRAIGKLSDAGVPVGVMAAPIVPGLSDSEIPEILRRAADAGAESAGWILLRLPLTVEPVFLEWLERTRPSHAPKVRSLIQQTRRGEMNQSQFGDRMRGSGLVAEQIQRLFSVFADRCGLSRERRELNFGDFIPPDRQGQMRLF